MGIAYPERLLWIKWINLQGHISQLNINWALKKVATAGWCQLATLPIKFKKTRTVILWTIYINMDGTMVLINVSNSKFNLDITGQDIITPAIILALGILIDIDTTTGILVDGNLITFTCKPGHSWPGFYFSPLPKG